MKIQARVLPFLVLWSLSFLGACTSDAPEDTTNQLLGKWIVQEGHYDGQVTDRLQDFTVEFAPDEMHSDLLQDLVGSASIPYALEGQEIVNQENKELRFAILKLEDTDLHLSFSARGHDFELHMTRAEVGASSTQ